MFLLLLLGLSATAQVTVPQVSTDTEKHYYKVANNTGLTSFIFAQNNVTQPLRSSNTEAPTLFTFEEAGEDGVYYIKSEAHGAYISHNGVGSAASVKLSQSKGDTEKWVIVRKDESDESNTAVAIVTYATKDNEGGTRLGWNPSGGLSGHIILYATNTSSNQASFWQMQEVEVTAPAFTPITSLDNFQNGWYQLKTGTGYSAECVGLYATCAGGGGSWIFGLTGMNNTPKTFVYVEKSGNNYYIKSTTGRYAKDNVNTNTAPFNLSLTAPDTDNPEQIKIGGASSAHVWGGWNLSNVYIIGSSSGGTAKESWRFQLSSADSYIAEHYDVYTVSVTGFSDNASVPVVCNLAANEGVKTVYDGGTFFLPKGTSVTASNFTVAGNVCTVALEGNDVNVALDPTVMSNADAVLPGVGKPGYPSEAPEALLTAYAAAQSAKSYSNMQTLKTQYASWAVASGTTYSDIVLPQDGKAYRIKNYIRTVSGSGVAEHYIQNNNGTAAFPTTATDETTVWVCQQSAEGETRTFVSANGDWCLGWKALSANDKVVYEVKKGVVMGCLQLRNPGASSYLAVTNEAWSGGNKLGFNQAGSGNAQAENWSTDFIIEEAEDYTGFLASVAAGANGNYGTLNLPFAVTVPEGVTANGVTLSEDNLEPTVVAEAGAVLPANTPVLLTGEAGHHTFVPAASLGTTALETGLRGTLAATAVSGTAYIMAYVNAAAGSDSEIQFFLLDGNDNTVNANKAYYVPATSLNVRALTLGRGGATAIDGVEVTTETSAPCYDLSGRRVMRPAKGIYIVDGKKVYVR